MGRVQLYVVSELVVNQEGPDREVTVQDAVSRMCFAGMGVGFRKRPGQGGVPIAPPRGVDVRGPC